MDKNILVSPQDVRNLADEIVTFMFGDTVEDYFCDRDEAIDDIVDDIEHRPEELISKLNDMDGSDKFINRIKDTREPKKPVMYVIKDKAGRQVSAPNPDDSELWSRVEAMEARGQKGLKVVAYIEECLTEELTEEQEDKIEIAKLLIDDLEEILEDGKGKLEGIKRLFGQLGIHSADIDPYFTNYLDGFISDENEMSCQELKDRIQEFIDENKSDSMKEGYRSDNSDKVADLTYGAEDAKPVTEAIAEGGNYTITYYLNTACRERRPETIDDVENDFKEENFHCESDFDAMLQAYLVHMEDKEKYDSAQGIIDAYELDFTTVEGTKEYFDSADIGDGSVIICKVEQNNRVVYDSGMDKEYFLSYVDEEDYSDSDSVPSVVSFETSEIDEWDNMEEDEREDAISEYLSDTYGYCHNGFSYNVENSTITCTVDWDLTEAVKDDNSKEVINEEVEPVVESPNDNTLINCYYSVDTGVDYYDDLSREEAVEKATAAKNSSDIEYIYVTRTDTYSNGYKEYEVVVDASRIEIDEPWTILTDNLKLFEVEEKLEEHVAIDTHDQLDQEEIKPVVEVEPLVESVEPVTEAVEDKKYSYEVGYVEGNPETYDWLEETFFITEDEAEAIKFAETTIDNSAEEYVGCSIVVIKSPVEDEGGHASQFEIFRSYVKGEVNEGFFGDDYKVFCQCNDGPQKLISLVATSDEKALEYAKSMYASEVSVYADDRANDWKCYIVNKTVCETLTDDDALNVKVDDEPSLDDAEILTESGWAENHYTMSPARQRKLEAIFDAGMWEDFEDAVYEACDIITGIHIDELEIENNAAKTEGPYITDEQIKDAKKLFYKLCDEWFAKIGKKETVEESVMEESVLDDAIKTLENGGILSCDRSGKYFISADENSLGKVLKVEDAEKILEDDRLVPYGGTDLTTTYKFSTLTEALGIANLQMFLDGIEVDTSSVATTGEVIIRCKSEEELARARRVLHKSRIPVEFEKGMTIYVDADRVYPANDSKLDEEIESEECAWCGHFFKPSELKDTDFGKICPLCDVDTSTQVALDDLDDDMSESFEDDWNDKIMKQALADKETKSDKEFNIGSDKRVTEDHPMYQKLVDLAKMLEDNSPNGYKYTVEETYEDFGAGMQWTTIICYGDSVFGSYQVLNTSEWLDLANGDKTVEETYKDVVNGEWFQDRKKSAKDVNDMKDALRYFDNLED